MAFGVGTLKTESRGWGGWAAITNQLATVGQGRKGGPHNCPLLAVEEVIMTGPSCFSWYSCGAGANGYSCSLNASKNLPKALTKSSSDIGYFVN